jgi:hypothetical protein
MESNIDILIKSYIISNNYGCHNCIAEDHNANLPKSKENCFLCLQSFCDVTNKKNIIDTKSKKLTNWKFAMPQGEPLRKKCIEKLWRVPRREDPGNFYYCCDGTVFACSYSLYEKSDYPEITVSQLLSLCELQPQKKKLPGWIKDNWIYAKNINEDEYYVKTNLHKINIGIDYPFQCLNGSEFKTIANLDLSDIINANDLKDYDLSEYEDKK